MNNYPDNVTGNEPQIAGYPEPTEVGYRVCCDEFDIIVGTPDEPIENITDAINTAKAVAAECAGFEYAENCEINDMPTVTVDIEYILDHGEDATDQYEYDNHGRIKYTYGDYQWVEEK